jgi:ferrous iron transport protein B
VDLPGTYSLTAYSIDEVIARNYIIEEEPDVVLHVVDPFNLARNLYLTFQLMELQCRMILVLNMWDRAKKLDYEMDVEALSRELGIQVLTVSSTTGEGVGKLLDTIVDEADAGATCGKIISFQDQVERKIIEVSEALKGKKPVPGYQYRWLAIKALEGDDRVWKRLEKLGLKSEANRAIGNTDPMDMEIAITDGRYAEVDRILNKVLRRKRIKERASDLIDSVVTGVYKLLQNDELFKPKKT